MIEVLRCDGLGQHAVYTCIEYFDHRVIVRHARDKQDRDRSVAAVLAVTDMLGKVRTIELIEKKSRTTASSLVP